MKNMKNIRGKDWMDMDPESRFMNNGFVRFPFSQPVDEYGNPVQRTKTEWPYSYDGFVIWDSRFPNSKCTGTVYTDRLYEWDSDKFNTLRKKHFDNGRQLSWSQEDPARIEKFLRDYLDLPNLKLQLIMEYCNVSSGYPIWRFDYNSGK